MRRADAAQVHALEIKGGATINSDYFKGLDRFKKAFPDQFLDGCIIYAGDQSQHRTHYRVMPWNEAGIV